MNWNIAIYLLLSLLVCAELYSTRRIVERLSDEIEKIKKYILTYKKNVDFLINELNKKENECFRQKYVKDEKVIDSNTNTKKVEKKSYINGVPDCFKDGMTVVICEDGTEKELIYISNKCRRTSNGYEDDNNGEYNVFFDPSKENDGCIRAVKDSDLNKFRMGIIKYRYENPKNN